MKKNYYVISGGTFSDVSPHFSVAARAFGTVGMTLIEPQGDDEVIAYGGKPSVGGQSQRMIFSTRPDLDCIFHAHVPIRPGSTVPVVSQRPVECGSHECGSNTANNLRDFGNGIAAVMLDKHGPNVVFRKDADPGAVIRFIEENFDLKGRTDDVEVSP